MLGLLTEFLLVLVRDVCLELCQLRSFGIGRRPKWFEKVDGHGKQRRLVVLFGEATMVLRVTRAKRGSSKGGEM